MIEEIDTMDHELQELEHMGRQARREVEKI